jgi:[protein-PII] uridylyltransferase
VSTFTPRLTTGIKDWATKNTLLGSDPVAYREALADLKQIISDHFDQQYNIDDLLKKMTEGIDVLLLQAWHNTGLDSETDMALIAVGGYGRRELHPGSDIDIFILLEKQETPTIAEKLSQYFTFLWDIGLDLGHSVRTLDECWLEGRRDITIATNFLESRLLTGSKDLYQQFQQGWKKDSFWSSQDFFTEKIKEQQKRYKRFGDTAYRLEPNLKESPGGLRDIQLIAWITKRHFNISFLRELVNHDFMSEEEYETLHQGRDFLWRIRFALHRLANRKEDRLLFDFQKTLAEEIGYLDKDHNLAVEQFMQTYYRTVTHLQRLSEMLIQHFEEEIILHNKFIPSIPINNRFQLRNGFIEPIDEKVFSNHPSALLEVFLLLQQQPESRGLRAATIRLIRANLQLIDDDFRSDIVCQSLFMEILRRPEGIYHELRLMNTYGVLAAYLPVFEQVVGRMQFDLFHIYTVDEHILMVLRNVRRMGLPKYADEIPKCSAIFPHLRKPELIYLAALFHDVGKGREGDHAETGAIDSGEFCLRHSLSTEDTELIVWLVRQHLVMSLTAQRKDISDPDIVRVFAQEVDSIERLNYLYLLTVADIRGTDPGLWNSWKASLLAELYDRTEQWLEQSQDPDSSSFEIILDNRLKSLHLLNNQSVDESQIMPLWATLHDEYFRRHAPETIVWHTKLMLDNPGSNPVGVDIMPDSGRGTTKIVIYTRLQPALFNLATSGIAQLGLNIVDARVYTNKNGMVLDTFHVQESNNSRCTEPERLEQIRAHLSQLLLAPPNKDPAEMDRPIPRKAKSFAIPIEISFSNPANKPYTELEIYAPDRPGLLADISQALFKTNVRVRFARIATVSEQAQDILQITTAGRAQLNQSQQQQVRQILQETLQTDSDI